GLAPAQAEVVRERFGARAVAEAGAPAPVALPLVVRRADASLFRSRPLGSWEYSFDLDPSPLRVRLAGPGFLGSVALAPRPAAELFTAHDDAEFAGVLENVFRVLAAYALLAGDALLLHSAAVEVDGAA